MSKKTAALTTNKVAQNVMKILFKKKTNVHCYYTGTNYATLCHTFI